MHLNRAVEITVATLAAASTAAFSEQHHHSPFAVIE
jgi:hypothetical protein